MGKAVAALDFGTSKVSALIGRMETGSGIAALGAGMTPYAGFRNHEWMEPNELSRIIAKTRRKAERKAHRRIRELYIVVPGEFTATELRRVSLRPTGAGSQITREDMGALYRMAADYDRPEGYRILHRDLLGASLDGSMYWEDPTGRQCGQVTAYLSFIAADGVFMESMEEILGEMGVGVLDFVAAPLSTGRMVAESAPADHTVIVIDSGYFTTDLIVMQNNCVLHHEIVEVGGGHITSDLSVALDLTMYEAELIKRRNPVGMATGGGTDRMAMNGDRKLSVRMDDVRAVMERRIEELAERVEKSIVKLGLDIGKQTQVFLTGGGVTLIRGARETVGRVLGVTAHHYAPRAPSLNSPVYTAVMGGVHWAIRSHADPNLSLWDRIKRSILEFI